MYRSQGLVLGILLLVSGCRGLAGPYAHKNDPQQVDDPHLTIAEQERRGRDRLALPDPSNNVAPRTYADPPSTYGR